MNERMKQLAYDAGFRFSTTGTVLAGGSEAVEKLLELIALEVTNTVIEVAPSALAMQILDKVYDRLGVAE